MIYEGKYNNGALKSCYLNPIRLNLLNDIPAERCYQINDSIRKRTLCEPLKFAHLRTQAKMNFLNNLAVYHHTLMNFYRRLLKHDTLSSLTHLIHKYNPEKELQTFLGKVLFSDEGDILIKYIKHFLMYILFTQTDLEDYHDNLKLFGLFGFKLRRMTLLKGQISDCYSWLRSANSICCEDCGYINDNLYPEKEEVTCGQCQAKLR